MLLPYEDLRPKKGIRYSRDHLRRKCKAGTFPQPINISDRCIAWLETEIDAWVKERTAERDRRNETPEVTAAP